MTHKQPKKMRSIVLLIFVLSSLVGFSGCSTISTLQSVADRAINQPNQIGSPEPSSTPQPSPSPLKPADSLVTPTPSAGEWDCSQVQNVDAKTAEGQSILSELIKVLQSQQPQNILKVERAWTITRLDNFIVIQALQNYSEPAVYVVKVESENYEWINSWGGPTIYEQQIADYFSKVIPDAPKELFYCTNFSGWLENTPAITVGPTDSDKCSRIEHLSPDSDKGRTLLEAKLTEWRITTHKEDLEYEREQFIDYLEGYYVMQAYFKDDGPMIFVVKQTSNGFEPFAMYGSIYGDRQFVILSLSEQIHYHSDNFPEELLTCLDVAEWFLPQ